MALLWLFDRIGSYRSCVMRRRNTLRLPTHDYRGDGNYLVTIGTHGRPWVLGQVTRWQMHPSPLGDLVLEQAWGVSRWCPHAAMDCVAVMPNHLHFILVMRGGTFDCAPRLARGPQKASVSMIVGQIKSRVTAAAIRKGLWLRSRPLWQRSFHDRWLPDLRALRAARRYLELNPRRWEEKYGPQPLGDPAGRPYG